MNDQLQRQPEDAVSKPIAIQNRKMPRRISGAQAIEILRFEMAYRRAEKQRKYEAICRRTTGVHLNSRGS